MDSSAYLAVKARITSLVDDANADVPIPACPGWTVHDLIGHLTGLCEDWVEHRLDGYAAQAWTEAQVARHSRRSVAEVLDIWSLASGQFVGLAEDEVMGPPARWAFGDAVVHEADLRGALGMGRVPPEAVAAALKGSIGRWRQVLTAAGVPSLLVRVPDMREWWIGTEDDPDAVVVEVPAYELFRALAGRRTESQVKDWDWRGGGGPFLDAGLPYPFEWAATELVD